MATFADTTASDMTDVFLNTAEFGEQVIYFPVDGGGSSRVITVVFGETETQESIEGNTLIDGTRLQPLAKNDAVTGINNPQLKDKIIRMADAQPRPFYFLSRVISRDAAGVELEFKRNKETETGRNVGRQRRL